MFLNFLPCVYVNKVHHLHVISLSELYFDMKMTLNLIIRLPESKAHKASS